MLLKVVVFLLFLTQTFAGHSETKQDPFDKFNIGGEELISKLNKAHQFSSGVNPYPNLMQPNLIPLNISDNFNIEPNYEALRISNHWNLTFNVLDAYKHFFQHGARIVDVLDLYSKLIDEEISGLSTREDYLYMAVGWPNTRPGALARRFSRHFIDVEEFFKNASTLYKTEYNRAELEKAVWLPRELKKHAKFIESLDNLKPFPMNIQLMAEAMRFLLERNERIEFVQVYDALIDIQGLRYAKIPRDKKLIQKTLDLSKEYTFLNRSPVKHDLDTTLDVAVGLFIIVVVTVFILLVGCCLLGYSVISTLIFVILALFSIQVY